MEHYFTIKDLPEEERPYEKCEKYGAGHLSTAELLAVLLKSGARGIRSTDLACSLLNTLEVMPEGLLALHTLSMDELRTFKGIGRIKAIQLKCLAEFSKRMAEARPAEGISMTDPGAVYRYYYEAMRHLQTEQAVVILLNGKNRRTGDFILSKGTVNASLVSPRELFLEALRRNAVAVILLHNHPSGDPAPSRQDILLTQKVAEAGRILDIHLLDHIIIGSKGYKSFREMELL